MAKENQKQIERGKGEKWDVKQLTNNKQLKIITRR